MIQRRLRDAATDMTHWSEFDYVVVNDDFERALADLHAIVQGRGDASRRNRDGLAELVGQPHGLTRPFPPSSLPPFLRFLGLGVRPRSFESPCPTPLPFVFAIQARWLSNAPAFPVAAESKLMSEPSQSLADLGV